MSEAELDATRNWLHLELGGAVKGADDTDFQMPPVKYVYRD